MENKIACFSVASSKFTIPYVSGLLWAVLGVFFLARTCALPLAASVWPASSPGGVAGTWRVPGTVVESPGCAHGREVALLSVDVFFVVFSVGESLQAPQVVGFAPTLRSGCPQNYFCRFCLFLKTHI